MFKELHARLDHAKDAHPRLRGQTVSIPGIKSHEFSLLQSLEAILMSDNMK